MRARIPAGAGPAAVLLVLAASAGCNIFAPLAILFAPRQVQKAEFRLTSGRLAVLIESANPGQENPVFAEALHDRLVEVFREKKISTQVVPRAELTRLQQSEPDFARWSLQRIGRAVRAEQILYVRIEDLRLGTTADASVLEPAVALRLKVVAVDDPTETARLWPGRSEREGRAVECRRQARLVSDELALDAETIKLARDTAYVVAAPFYDVDLEHRIPPEP